MKVYEINAQTNEEIYRDATEKEIEVANLISEIIESDKAQKLENAKKRSAILEKLGLTEDEIQVLFA